MRKETFKTELTELFERGMTIERKFNCMGLELPYYETSHHRELVLDEFLSYLDKK